MESLKDILWPIVVVGGLGAFIDFLIGRTGQDKAKNFMLKWWVRFDDIHWNNFGREEGLFAGQLIERWFGQSIWSFRRIASGFVILSFLLFVGYLTFLIPSEPVSCFFCIAGPSLLFPRLIASFTGFCMSVSFTKFVAVRMAYACGTGEVKNFVIFLAILIFNYLMLIFWLPMTEITKNMIGEIWFVLTQPEFKTTTDRLHMLLGFFEETVNLAKDLLFATVYDELYPKILTTIFSTHSQIDVFALFTLSSFPSVFRFL